jgi:phosphoserine phosphatase RsbU/P
MRTLSFTVKIVLLTALPLLIYFLLGTFVQITNSDRLFENVSAITGDGARQIYLANLKDRSRDIAGKISLHLEAIRNELAIVAGAAQTLIDRDDLRDLGRKMQATPFLANRFVYEPEHRHSNLAVNDADISLSVWGYLHDDDGALTADTERYVAGLTPIKLTLNAVGKHGRKKGWLYVVGPKETPVMLMTPWAEMPAVFDKLYAGHNEHNWWDFFFPGIVEGWQAWRSPTHGPGESPVPGDEVTLTPLYEDAGGTGLMVTFFQPLWSADRRANQGAAALDYNIDNLIDMVRGEAVGLSGFAFLVQGEGDALGLGEDAAQILGLNADKAEGGGVRKTSYSLGNSRIEALRAAAAASLTGDAGFSSHTIAGADGNRYLISFRRVADYNLWPGSAPIVRDSLHLVLAVPETEILKVSKAVSTEIAELSEREIRSTVALSAIILLAAVGPAGFFAMRATRQIRLLSTGVQAVKERRFDVAVDSVSDDEIGRLAGTFNTMTSELKATYEKLQNYAHDLEQKVQDRTLHLEQANRELERLSNMDGLTKVNNRRYFDNELGKLWSLHARRNLPISVIMLDVDHFKLYNDTYGHQMGDDCLCRVAGALMDLMRRSSDVLARYGGEEFIAVICDDAAAAQRTAERMRAAVEALALPHSQTKKGVVSISVGVATGVPSATLSTADLIRCADEALYACKREGRDRVTAVTAGDDAVSS